MRLLLRYSIALLVPLFVFATLVLADPPANTGGRWESGAGINQITMDVSLAGATNGNIDVKMGDEKITLQGGWDTDSSTGRFKDGTQVRVRCNNSSPWNCWLEVNRPGSGRFVRMRWIGPTPVAVAPVVTPSVKVD